MSDADDLANFPSLGDDPANDGTLGGMCAAIFNKLLQNTEGMLPCEVIAATSDRNFITAHPLVKTVGTSGATLTRGQIAKVPLLNPGGGNWLRSDPVAPGDQGWIFAGDRDISLYLQSNAEAIPNTALFHTFNNGMFVPDKARFWTLANEDAARSVWQSLDGSVKIALGVDELKIVQPTLVEIVTPHVTMSGDLKVDAGLGFFNTAPPGSKPAITGALSGVADADAKAVLTSIIAVLVGNGQASNGTT